METRKLLVKVGDIAVLTCPSCSQTKDLPVSDYREKGKRELRIKCSCDEIFDICLEYRKHPRQEARLLGRSINLSNHREDQDVIVKNISQGGIGLCPFSGKHRTRKDDQLLISFTLNNSKQTSIETNVTVRSVAKDYIGCEFNSTDHFKTALGFYLIS
jgi:hypothetical protein